jgi:hypothetical protein
MEVAIKYLGDLKGVIRAFFGLKKAWVTELCKKYFLGLFILIIR